MGRIGRARGQSRHGHEAHGSTGLAQDGVGVHDVGARQLLHGRLQRGQVGDDLQVRQTEARRVMWREIMSSARHAVRWSSRPGQQERMEGEEKEREWTT